MHGAPSVSYPVGRSRFAGALVLVLSLLGIAATAAWWLQAPAPTEKRVAAIACAVLVIGAALLAWWRSSVGQLAWTGETWTWTSARSSCDGEVHAALDLQSVLLLKFEHARRGEWLWLERSSAPARWDDVRRAVYSRARPQPLPEAKQPANSP